MKSFLTLIAFLILSGMTHAQIIDPIFTDLPNSAVDIVTLTDTYVYIGGSFTEVGRHPMSRVARYFRANGQLDLSWTPQPDNAVSSIATNSSDVFIGGTFMNVQGKSRVHIAKVSGSVGELDTVWNPGVGTYTNFITLQVSIPTKMQVVDNYLYVAGDFQTAGSIPRSNMAKISTSGIGEVDPLWNPSPNKQIMTFRIKDNTMYVGGDYNTIGGTSRSFLSKISLHGTGAVDMVWNPECSGRVWNMELDGDNLYVTGQFNTIGGQYRLGIARINSNGSGDADTSWNPNAQGFFCGAIAISTTHIYTTCNGMIGGQNKWPMAKISKNGAAITVPEWDFVTNNSFLPFAAINYDNTYGRLFIGGYFSNPTSRLAVLNEKMFSMNPELHFDAGTISQIDGSAVSFWTDNKGNDDNASQTVSNQQPVFRVLSPFSINGKPCVEFNTGKGLTVAANPAISGGSEKSVFAIIRTGNEVVSKQMILDLGGTNSGFNIYIQGFQLYAGVWNQNGGWHINRQILSDRIYLLQLVYFGNKLRLSLTSTNGTVTTVASSIAFAPSAVGSMNHTGIGCVSDQTRFHNGYGYADFSNSFLGDIAELIVLNTANVNTRNSIYDSLSSKYNFASSNQPLMKSNEFDIDDEVTVSTQNSSVALYPNPASGAVTIECNTFVKKVSLFSLSGEMISDIPIVGEQKTCTVTINNFMQGMYRVVILTSEGSESALLGVME